MGDFKEIKSLLASNLLSINTALGMHQQMIQNLQNENNQLKDMVRSLLEKKTQHKNQHNDTLKTEVMNKFKRNKKRMIKNKILENTKFTHLTIPEIKEIIVDQHCYCSKATFYRYIEELKRQDFIHINERNIVKIKPLVEAV